MKLTVLAMTGVMCIAGITTTACAADVEHEYYENGKVRKSTEYNNATGEKRKVKYFRPDGSLAQSLKYDENGEKIAEANYSSNGNLQVGSDG